jgi:hypothetical protein
MLLYVSLAALAVAGLPVSGPSGVHIIELISSKVSHTSYPIQEPFLEDLFFEPRLNTAAFLTQAQQTLERLARVTQLTQFDFETNLTDYNSKIAAGATLEFNEV